MDFLKIAGKLAGGKPGQDQTQGSGSSGLMHKITDAVTGQNHHGEKQNQRPYGSFPGNMSGPGAYQNMPHSGSPTGHYQPSGGYGQMGGPYPGNYQGRPAEAHSGSYDPRYPGRDQHYGSGYEHGGPPRMYGSPPQNQAPYYGAQDGHGNQPGAYGQHGYERRDEHNYGAGGPGYEQREYGQHDGRPSGHDQQGYGQHGNNPSAYEQHGNNPQGYQQHGNSSHGYEQRPYGQHGHGQH